jgi:hypothetical protein
MVVWEGYVYFYIYIYIYIYINQRKIKSIYGIVKWASIDSKSWFILFDINLPGLACSKSLDQSPLKMFVPFVKFDLHLTSLGEKGRRYLLEEASSWSLKIHLWYQRGFSLTMKQLKIR